jgi:hypothetical protein
LGRHYQLHVRLKKFTNELRILLFVALRESNLDDQVPALNVAVLAQAVNECCGDEGGPLRG